VLPWKKANYDEAEKSVQSKENYKLGSFFGEQQKRERGGRDESVCSFLFSR
jgi:hypothetical protein